MRRLALRDACMLSQAVLFSLPAAAAADDDAINTEGVSRNMHLEFIAQVTPAW
jgi:hypothetical protein